MGIISGVGSSATVSSASGGKIYAYNAISTSPVIVAPANPNRRKIIFHNPGTGNLNVGPVQVLNSSGQGIPLVPSTVAVGGTFLLFPGAFLTIEGECQVAWQALAAANSNNPLTVMDSNV